MYIHTLLSHTHARTHKHEHRARRGDSKIAYDAYTHTRARASARAHTHTHTHTHEDRGRRRDSKCVYVTDVYVCVCICVSRSRVHSAGTRSSPQCIVHVCLCSCLCLFLTSNARTKQNTTHRLAFAIEQNKTPIITPALKKKCPKCRGLAQGPQPHTKPTAQRRRKGRQSQQPAHYAIDCMYHMTIHNSRFIFSFFRVRATRAPRARARNRWL